MNTTEPLEAKVLGIKPWYVFIVSVRYGTSRSRRIDYIVRRNYTTAKAAAHRSYEELMAYKDRLEPVYVEAAKLWADCDANALVNTLRHLERGQVGLDVTKFFCR